MCALENDARQAIGPERLARICRVLGIQADEMSVRPNPNSGMNNATFIISARAGQYLYRVPGKGTEQFSSRANEAFACRALASYRITDEVLDYDEATGAKLSVYYQGSRVCDPNSDDDLRMAMQLLRRYHALPVRLQGRDDPYMRMRQYGDIARDAGSGLLRRADYAELRARVEQSAELFACAEDELCPVHADCLPGNVLFRADGEPILIDLEFAAMGCAYGDLADFCHDAQLAPERCAALLGMYLTREPAPQELRRLYFYCAAVALMWSGWAAYKAQTERAEAEFFDGYADMSIRYAAQSLMAAAEL